METAKTILAQMGGPGRLAAMVGAKNFVAGADFVQFKFAMCRKTNCCKVIYNAGSDLYTVEFWKIGRLDAKLVNSYSEVYAEDLIRFFEEETGLYLKL